MNIVDTFSSLHSPNGILFGRNQGHKWHFARIQMSGYWDMNTIEMPKKRRGWGIELAWIPIVKII